MLGPAASFSVLMSAVVLALWGSRVDLADFYTLVTERPPEGTVSPDLVCMMTQCGQETLACLTDRDCLKTLACLVPCGDDQTCTFHCTLNYENEIFHEMTACNIIKAGCLTLKEPEEATGCDMKEMFAVSELTEQQLLGTWYIVRGLSPIYDCFPCQIFTFGRNSSDDSLFVMMDYQVERESGEILDKTVKEEISQNLPDKQGFLEMAGIQNGLYHSEEWRVLERNENFMIAQYCGVMKNWAYEGAVAFSRNSPVSRDEMMQIESELRRHGYSPDNFCSPKYVGCNNIR